jgi:hypothetical protein
MDSASRGEVVVQGNDCPHCGQADPEPPPKHSAGTAVVTQTAASGGVGGGVSWYVIEAVPDDWKAIAGLTLALGTAALTALQPYLEGPIAEFIKLQWTRLRSWRSYRKLKKLYNDESAPPYVRERARIQMLRLQEVKFRIILEDAADVIREAEDITGTGEITKEDIKKAEEIAVEMESQTEEDDP